MAFTLVFCEDMGDTYAVLFLNITTGLFSPLTTEGAMATEVNVKLAMRKGLEKTRRGFISPLVAAILMSVLFTAAEAQPESCESLARMYAHNPHALDIDRLSRLQECIGRELAKRLGYPGGYAPPAANPGVLPPSGGSSRPLPVLPPPPDSPDTPPYTGR